MAEHEHDVSNPFDLPVGEVGRLVRIDDTLRPGDPAQRVGLLLKLNDGRIRRISPDGVVEDTWPRKIVEDGDGEWRYADEEGAE